MWNKISNNVKNSFDENINYFPVFGPEKTLYLGTFHVVHVAIRKFNTMVIKENALKNFLPMRALYFNGTNNRKTKKNVNFLPL